MDTDRCADDRTGTQHALAGFELQVPNGWSAQAIAELVERVLRALDTGSVGAEYAASNVWGPTWTQYLPGENGRSFRKRHYDERLGWVGGPIPRAGVREELIEHLTRSVSRTSNRSHGQPVNVADRFRVQPVAELRRR